MLGVLLVSMTTGTESVKIPGANGTGVVGVTPKEDTHNYSWTDRQSEKSEVCKQRSQADRKHSGSYFYLFLYFSTVINKVSYIKYHSFSVI